MAAVVVTVVALVLVGAARYWLPRALVVHAALRKDGLGWRVPLVHRTARLAMPVRLTGGVHGLPPGLPAAVGA
ncbi:MAG: hypothetical protein GEV11_09485, partial [Streptosporangiales bacterium]|nr:hypothetical protein [Streptosporangiales bacterium]